jgi:hypothetical protein
MHYILSYEIVKHLNFVAYTGMNSKFGNGKEPIWNIKEDDITTDDMDLVQQHFE